jgi:FSR family fosmidomycin resistance protein-like MFS transporter
VTSSVAQPIFGVLSDRGAQRILLPLGVLLSAGGFAALGVAPTYPLMLAAIALSGTGSAIFHPEATKSARYIAGEHRATGMSFFTIGGNIGVALGPLVLIGIVGLKGLHGTWLYLIPGVIVTGIVAAIMPSIARAETAHFARMPAEKRASRPKAMVLLIAVVALRSVIYSGILVFVPLYAVNVLHRSPAENGPLLFAILAAGALSTIAGAALADRNGDRRTMVVSFALVPPLLAVYLLVPGIVGIVALVLVGAFLIATTTITVVMAHDFMPNRLALASALVIGFTSGLGGLGIATLGRAADVFGLPAVLWSLVGVGVVGTGLSMLLPGGRRDRAPEDAALDARNLARSTAHR